MLAGTLRFAPTRTSAWRRAVSTLASNPQIKVFDNPSSPASYILTYLDTKPPYSKLAIGTTTAVPPTPKSFRENHHFVEILDQVVQEYGHLDEDIVSQARAFASPGGFNLGSGARSSRNTGPAEAALGSRAEVVVREDFGRIAWPEDILGSVEVDGSGNVVGKVQPSGTYRIVTNEGILGLSPFLTEKLVARLKEEEGKERGS
ncbi:hypothetical protein ACCO45_013033 [Purpureocillium lilacinum]|uniref:Uncharacterized protein n=1 Tax=Purpureocillium lilacinum TaxID=33203 RepID=A0ACC4DCQ8_PURLI